MKIRTLLCGIALAACTFYGNAQNSNDELKRRINEAVINVYNEELSKNPNDYTTLMARANQYFMSGDYLKSLDDVTQALRLTSRKDSETLFEEYMLRAKIYGVRGESDAQLADLTEANRINPTHVNCLGLLAETNYELGKYDEAKLCYDKILRLDAINYEAMAGLARVAVKQNNFGLAAEHVDKAVKLYPAEPQVFINRAEVLNMMDQEEAAAQDLISALSVGSDNAAAIEALVEMSNTRYDAVIKALTSSIEKAPNVGMFPYLRGMIAMAHLHYRTAYTDFSDLIKRRIYDFGGIHSDCAKSCFELGDREQATFYIDKAIRAEDNADYYVTKSQIELAGGNKEAALAAANKALLLNADHADALAQKARVFISQGKFNDALTQLNMAIMNDATVAENLMLRAWLQKYKLSNNTAANADYNTVVLTLGSDMQSLRGFALHALGRDEEAMQWAKDIINESPLPGGEAYYYAACLATACSKNDQAIEYLKSALANGYGSAYNIKTANDQVVSLTNLRKDSRFSTIVKQYSNVF